MKEGRGPEPVGSGIPRAVEAGLALVGLALSSPLLILGAASVILSSRGPIFFRQERVGRGGKLFRLWKLRTMRVSTPGPDVTAGDDPRITRVGRWLRWTKIDEIPQLWNVVRGDMSLVGPRPEAARYVDAASPVWRRILSVRPGLTDPATIRFRDEERLLAKVAGERESYYREVILPSKLETSLGYLLARTWKTDVAVLLRTVLRVAAGSRLEGQETVPRNS